MRLRHIADDLSAVVERYHPQEACIESVYFGVNVRSAIPTAHARGAALVAVSLCGVEVGEYTPMQIKQSVVGTGAADKGGSWPIWLEIFCIWIMTLNPIMLRTPWHVPSAMPICVIPMR